MKRPFEGSNDECQAKRTEQTLGEPAALVALPDDIRMLAPARAIINLAALRHNARVLQNVCADLGSRLMGVLKADAYGHGAVKVARELRSCGVEAFAVATLVEAVELRMNGLVDEKILVLGAPLPDDVPLFAKYKLDIMISSLDVVSNLCETVQGKAHEVLNAHLYVETGMTRLGLQPEELPNALDALLKTEHIKVVGVCSHFAEADNPQSEYVEQQMENFDQALGIVHQHPFCKGLTLDVHFGNSAALLDERFHELLGKKYPGGFSRPGIALYGGYPQVAQKRTEVALGQEAHTTCGREWIKEVRRHTTASEPLVEVMTLQVKVMNIMVVEAGTSVGYSRTWQAESRCLIATLGIGYADGYPRVASNKGQATIRGRYYPVVGNVCMDMIMVNLGEPTGLGSEVKVGDEAVLFGPGGLAASQLAWYCGTIHCELLSGLTKRVQRVYVDDARVVDEFKIGPNPQQPVA